MPAYYWRRYQGLRMDKLIQQVNLYQPIFKQQRQPFSAGVMAVNIGIAALLMLAATLYAMYQLHDLEKGTVALEQQKQQLQLQLDAVKARLKPRKLNQLLVAQKDKMATDLKDARRLSRLLASEIEDQGRPYSVYFRGLAESSIDGLWLEQLKISQGGELLSLSGSALRPELVPRLLQSLKDKEAFAGHSFGEVQMLRNKDAALDHAVKFELKTQSAAGEQADAG